MELHQDRWTVIATAYNAKGGWRRWAFCDGFNDHDVHAASLRDSIIVMQRRVGLELQLVAMLPPPAWKRVVNWRKRNPLILPHMKVKS